MSINIKNPIETQSPILGEYNLKISISKPPGYKFDCIHYEVMKKDVVDTGEEEFYWVNEEYAPWGAAGYELSPDCFFQRIEGTVLMQLFSKLRFYQTKHLEEKNNAD